jgi:hypothetical protein
VGLDHKVAENLATAAAGVGATTFNESPISSPDDKIVGDGAADHRYGVQLIDNTFKQDGPAPTPVPPAPPAPDLDNYKNRSKINSVKSMTSTPRLHQPSQPTLGGLAVAASTGCAGGALVASETGIGAIPTCVVTGSLAGIGYLLGKIWE